jgi:SH3-like domain-containing protein
MCSSSKQPSMTPTSNTASLFGVNENATAAWIQAATANCRAAASKTAAVTTRLSHATEVSVLETSGTWSRVASSGQQCWVASRLIGNSVPVEPETTTEAPSAYSEPGYAVAAPIERSSSRDAIGESSSVYYRNCSAARAAGAAPIHAGEPGYASHLDRDADGVACE